MGEKHISDKLRGRFSIIAHNYMKALNGRNDLSRTASGAFIRPLGNKLVRSFRDK